jgi:hypothetical protein
MEVCRVFSVSEEQSGSLHIELLLCAPSVDKEVYWEGRFGVCSEETRRDEGELWVGGDRLLNALESELGSNGVIVETSSKSVAVVNKLRKDQ